EIKGIALVAGIGLLAIGLLVLAIRAKAERLRAQHLAEAAAQPDPAIAVDALIVSARPLVDSLRLPGLVRPWREAEIASEVSGRVLEKRVADGAAVQAGEVLVRLDPADYRINLERCRAALALAQETYRRTAELVKQNVKPPQELDRDENALRQAQAAVAAAELALARCEIRSPFAGVVEEIIPEVGEFMSPGAKVARLLDVRKVKVDVAIPEQDVNAVQGLEQCDLRLSAQSDVCLQGKRLQLGLAPLREALVYRLQLEVDNAQGLLRPGMFVEAEVVRSRKAAAVMVPIFAVLPTDPGYAVYVVE
ncbi:MAG: efflux RND transporter periplasmic adaptor subunit, partial [Planctomycetota bacterium]|nr:efflux RND transporter periplasmic adaptor subunit [Planctomycetota bacterium]